MIPYQSIDYNFNGVPEQCFVLEVIGSTQHIIPKKYIDMDLTIATDVDALNTASGPYPKAGGVIAANIFKASNGTSFYSTYHSMIKVIKSKPETLGAPFDNSQIYNSSGTWKHTANDATV